MNNSQYTPLSETVSAAEVMAATQTVYQQVEGLSLRVENRAEFTLIAPVLQPDGAKVFKDHVAKAQTEAAFWEGTVATVHDLRVGLINNDTQIFFAATYSDDFKPYVADVIKFAPPSTNSSTSPKGERRRHRRPSDGLNRTDPGTR